MMIGTWIWVVCVIIVGAVGIIWAATKLRRQTKAISIVIISVLIIVASAIPLYMLYGTESGKRAQKDFESNNSGGIERIVEVYDVNGELIKKYEGKFDVEYDNSRIIFDDEDGKRHIIYYTTGTVIIDEK